MIGVFAVLACGCYAKIAPELAGAPLVRCPYHCTTGPFIIEEQVAGSR